MRNSNAKILETRGHFWWLGEQTPEGRFAPRTAKFGVLEIGENGLTQLNISGSLIQSDFLQLDSKAQLQAGNELDALYGRSIAGKIDDDQRCVYLRNVVYKGPGRSIDGNVSEWYQAGFCLLGNTSIPRDAESFAFSKLSVELTGLEEWLRGDALVVTPLEEHGINRSQQVSYSVRQNGYEIDGAQINLRTDVHQDAYEQIPTREIKFSQHDWLDYIPAEAAPPEELKQEFGHIEEFLSILTGTYYSLEWPQIATKDGDESESYTLYFFRNIDKNTPPEAWKLWTIFPQTRASFGSLYSEWKRKRREFGPGFYLYLGALRSSSMYIEHRFVNLIWGIESLHRARNPDAKGPASEKELIEALLVKVQNDSDSATRRWLKRQIESASEPTLMDRIVGTFATLPWGVESASLNQFAKRCAGRRNDISHYGGPRKDANESYETFLLDLMKLSEALSYLYHAALLKEIGLDGKTLVQCLMDMPIGHRIRRGMEQAGLIFDKPSPNASA